MSPLRSLLWSGIETFGTLVIGLLSVVIIARLIGPDAFGLAAIGLGLTLISAVGITSLVHDGLVRSTDYSDLQFDSSFTFSLLAGVAAALGLGLLAVPLARLLAEPELVVVLLAFFPMVLFGALSAPLLAERRRALDFRTVGRHQLFSRSLGLAIGIAVALAGGGVWSVVMQQLVTTGLLMTTLMLKRQALPRLRIDWPALRPILRFSQYIAGTGLLIQATERLFLILVSYLYGLGAAGQWAVASRLVENVVGVVSHVLYHVSLAHLTGLRDAHGELTGIATRNRDLLIFLVLPGFVAVTAAAEPIIALLFGTEWMAVATLVPWMLLGALFVMRRLFAQVALNVLGRSETMLHAATAESAAAIVMVVLFAPLGVIGAAMARGLSFAIGWLIIFRQSARMLGMEVKRESIQLGIDLVVAVITIAAAKLLLANVTFATALTDILAHAGLAGGLALALLLGLRFDLTRWLVERLMARCNQN